MTIAEKCADTNVRDAVRELRQEYGEISSKFVLTAALQKKLHKAQKACQKTDSTFAETTPKKEREDPAARWQRDVPRADVATGRSLYCTMQPEVIDPKNLTSTLIRQNQNQPQQNRIIPPSSPAPPRFI